MSDGREMLVSTGSIWREPCSCAKDRHHIYRRPAVPVDQVNELRRLAKELVDVIDGPMDRPGYLSALEDLRRAVYGP